MWVETTDSVHLSYRSIWWTTELESNQQDFSVTDLQSAALPFRPSMVKIWRSRQALPLRGIFRPHNGLAIRALMTDLSTTPKIHCFFCVSYSAYVVGPSGIEPTSPLFQSGVSTSFTTVPLYVNKFSLICFSTSLAPLLRVALRSPP